MDILSLPMNRIMQLPEGCFGRRWPVVFTFRTTEACTAYYISELALPDRCVLWELCFSSVRGSGTGLFPDYTVNLKLGDQLPTTDAQIAAMEELVPGLDERDAVGGVVRYPLDLKCLRLPIVAQGRRVVLRVNYTVAVAAMGVVGFVFSGMPTEVPEWLLLA